MKENIYTITADSNVMDSITGTHGQVSLRISDGIATMTLRNPDKLNALTEELAFDLREMTEKVDQRDQDQGDISVIVLKAIGRAFCTGLDTDWISSDDYRREDSDIIYEVEDWLHYTSIPVIAAGRGPIVGGGANLLCVGADIQVIGADAEIWWPEIEFGMAPLDRVVYLANEVGSNRALELILMGDEKKLSATEAEEIGLVNRVVESERTEEVAAKMAETIATYDRQHNLAKDVVGAIHDYRRESFGASISFAARQSDRPR